MARGFVTLEQDRCKGCALCVEVCRPGILAMSTTEFNGKGHRPVQVTDMEGCTGCSLCAMVCPDIVFSVYRAKRKVRDASAA